MDICPICLEILDDETTIIIVGCCSKQFHTECLMKCIKNECPLCRAPRVKVNEVNEEIIRGTVVVEVHQDVLVPVQYKRYVLCFLSCFAIFTISMFIASLVKQQTL